MQDFFNPVNITCSTNNLCEYIDIHTKSHFPDLENANIIILGVENFYNDNDDYKFAPNEIRKSFYSLFPGNWDHIKIADIGNYKIDNNNNIIKDVISEFIDIDKHIILLGGSQDISYDILKSLNNTKKNINFSIIDSEIDLKSNFTDNHPKNYLNKILKDQSLTINNISIIGIQNFYNNPEIIKLAKELYIDIYNLGEITNDITESEPELRNADFVSIDISAIQNSQMPAQTNSKPNGFNGIEICKITRYIGLSQNNRIIGIFEMNPFFDKNHVGSNLIAQTLWYYIDGKNLKLKEKFFFNKDDMIKFHVPNDLINLIFYKDEKTNQWWVQLLKHKNEKQIFPCTINDYKNSVKNILTKRIKNIIEKK